MLFSIFFFALFIFFIYTQIQMRLLAGQVRNFLFFVCLGVFWYLTPNFDLWNKDRVASGFAFGIVIFMSTAGILATILASLDDNKSSV